MERAPKSLFDIAKSIIGMAAGITSEILFLDVAEDNNRRRSFDINMYKSGITLFALHPLLLRMRDHYSVPSTQFHAFFESVKDKKFGHLSGGVDREGAFLFYRLFRGREALNKEIQGPESGAGLWGAGNGA